MHVKWYGRPRRVWWKSELSQAHLGVEVLDGGVPWRAVWVDILVP